MAKNRGHLEKPALPDSKPGDDDGEDTSSEDIGSSDSGSESESEQSEQGQGHTQFLKKPSSVPVQPSAKPQKSTFSSDEEDSGSDNDSSEQVAKAKPLASKKMDEPQKSITGKPRSKPNTSDTPTPAKPIVAKRPADVKEDDAKGSKKKKKPKPDLESLVKQSPITGDDSKKFHFQRIWSEDDEIVILEGYIDYAGKKKVDPISDLAGFHEFMQKKLHQHVSFTRTQLQDKVRRLKKKYVNSKRRKSNDKSISFSKPLEQKCFELSEAIWGNESGKDSMAGNSKASGSAKKKTRSARASTPDNAKPKEVKNVKIENGDAQKRGVRRSILNGEDAVDMIFKTEMEVLDGEKKKEMERGLKKLRVEELELYLKQLDLLRAKTMLALDALKSSEF